MSEQYVVASPSEASGEASSHFVEYLVEDCCPFNRRLLHSAYSAVRNDMHV
jgi:hypothetical protein